MKWYVLQVYSGFENKVIDAIYLKLEEYGMSHLIEEISAPNLKLSEAALVKTRKNNSNKKLLIGYILIKMNLNKDLLSLITSLPRVSGFLGEVDRDGLPYSVDKKDVESFLSFSESIEEDIVSLSNMFEIGNEVKIITDPFYGFKGVVEFIDDDKRKIQVSVSIFGRSTPVDLEWNQVEKIS